MMRWTSCKTHIKEGFTEVYDADLNSTNCFALPLYFPADGPARSFGRS